MADSGQRVAIIHNIVAPYRIGLFEEIGQAGFDLTVFYCDTTHKHRPWNFEGGDHYESVLLKGFSIDFNQRVVHINPSIVRKLARGYDFIVIGGANHVTMQLAFIMSKIVRVPIILWTENIGNPDSNIGPISSLAKLYYTQVARRANAILVPGTASLRFHREIGIESNRIFISPNAIDNLRFRRICESYGPKKQTIKDELGVGSKKVALFSGRTVKEKGLEYLLDAYRAIRLKRDDLALVVMGEGRDYRYFRGEALRLGLRDVFFTGWQTGNDLIKYYSIADFLVLPTFRDVWGFVINEAMACGLPVIVTDQAGAAPDMVIPGRTGFIARARDSSSLLKGMEEILIDENQLKRMRTECINLVQSGFSYSLAASRFKEAILSCS